MLDRTLRPPALVPTGAARPAITASPVGSMLATSNVGTLSPPSGDRGDPISASTTALASDCALASGADTGFEIAGAVVAAVASTGCSRRTC